MISITGTRPEYMPQDCGMKGMHDDAKKIKALDVEQSIKTQDLRDKGIGNNLDLRI